MFQRVPRYEGGSVKRTSETDIKLFQVPAGTGMSPFGIYGAGSSRPHVDVCAKKRHGCLATPDGKGAFTFFRVMTGELIKKEGKSAPTAELRITYDR